MQRLKIILQSKIFLVISLIFIIIYILLFTKIIKYNSKYDDNRANIIGTILDYKVDGDKLSLIIKGKEKVSVTYYISSFSELEKIREKLELGTKIKVIGTLKEPINNTIPNTFNYKKYLYNKKIYKLMNAEKIEFINSKINILYRIKNSFINKTNKFNTTKGYMYAFILGDNGYIDSDVYTSLKNNGVTHLFAVSGMHISFLVMAISTLLKKIKMKDKIINITIIIFLFFYMFLIGFNASVVRASLLYLLLLINRKLNLKINSIYILYLLFVLLLIINPFYIYDLGFIYSFLTSFGLMLYNKKIIGNYFLKLLKVSIIAFLFSLPITIYNFYEFNLLTILNNIIIVPLVSLILFPLSLFTFMFPFLEPILNIGFNILEIINKTLDIFAINIIVPKINVIFIIIYYLLIYLIYKKGFKYIVLLVILILVIKLKPYLDSNEYVYFLDVGQGDSALVITEHKNEVILIDTGGKIEYSKEEWQKKNSSYKISDNIIIFIKSLGINKIDELICTHGDYDHIGEAINLINNFKVEKVIFNCGEFNDLEQDLIKVLDKKKIPYYSCIKELSIDDNKLYFLNNKLYDDENNNSNVIYTKLNNYKILFMGDAGIEVEEDLIEKYSLKNIDVLKVGHHGSKTSSSKKFLDNINAKYSIISVGRNNRYGHPNEEVLDNLENSTIYRTDLEGSIRFKIKNNKLKIKTYSP